LAKTNKTKGKKIGAKPDRQVARSVRPKNAHKWVWGLTNTNNQKKRGREKHRTLGSRRAGTRKKFMPGQTKNRKPDLKEKKKKKM